MNVSAPWIAFPEILENQAEEPWIFRTPQWTDGDAVHQLIASCPPLDVNSSYCNFLQSGHFSDTCVVAEHNGELAGFISAYRKPDQPSHLFVWQVAVSPSHRGKGLAYDMLNELLVRRSLDDIQTIETTITRANKASWALFTKLDRANGKRGATRVFLDEKKHFKGKHDTEYLYTIPLSTTHKS